MSENSRCHVAAFTGKAANNISGVTLNSLLFIPVAKPKDLDELPDLTGLPLQTLQSMFPVGSSLIIDEYSMVGLRLFSHIEQRLRQATGFNRLTFGGISVILVGDILQLPPVLDRAFYYPGSTNENNEYLKGRAVFGRFDTVVELKINQRQIDPAQQPFRDFLMALRIGAHDPAAAYDLLQSRMINKGISQAILRQFQQTAVSLNPCNAKVDLDNNIALRKLSENQGQARCRIEAVCVIVI